MVQFSILREGNRATKILEGGCTTALTAGIPWDISLERREVQDNCLIFKDHLLQAQKWSVQMSWKSSKGGRTPVWMNRKLKLRCKKEAYKTEKDRWPRRNIETLSKHGGMRWGKLKVIWSWSCGERHEGQQQRLFQVPLQQKEDWEKCGLDPEWGRGAGDKGDRKG